MEGGRWVGCGSSLASCRKPDSEHGKGRQGDSTSNNLGTSVAVLGPTGPVSTVTVRVVAIGWGRSSVVGVARDPAVIAQRLVPQEIGFGRVGLVSGGEESGVLSVGISIDGADSCDVRVELSGSLFTRIRVNRKVKGFLDRPSGVGGMLKGVPAGVFSEASVCLPRWGMRTHVTA